MSLSARSATAADKEFCRDVHHQAYKDVVIRQFKDWDDDMQEMMFDEAWARIQRKTKILLWDETPCGYSCSDRKSDHFLLIELVILPEFQRKGIGSSIIDKLIQKARSAKLPVRLSVLLQSKAKELYERKGFTVVEKTKTHYRMVLKALA